MKEFLATVLLLSVILIPFRSHAQPHVHGQGELLIAQEGNVWHLELSIPVVDALGFAHQAQTSAEKQALNDLATRLERNTKIIEVDGQCALEGVSHSLTAEADDSHTQHGHSHHHERDNDHHGHDEHNQRAEDDKEHHSHRDVKAQYQFRCEDEVTAIRAVLFESMPSLTTVQTQWVTNQGQGTRELRPERPVLMW